ncbi:hypothetical protein DFH08DRAFT_440520 [Mycena albidolilacea]|uniref:Uncharacterized protein n=1 Tax=Mycena albidolilacea TaxID=1033008 RepID=A0AAD7F0M7_9AGAR|nr:hypothetical protein DFH08DRAFT_440520 [Mycena albidolilacea]
MEYNGYKQGEYIFPAPQYTVVSPAPYMPPEGSYGHPLAFQPTEPSITAPDAAATSPRKCTGSDSASPPTVKRGRGRPRGSKKKATPAAITKPPPSTRDAPPSVIHKANAKPKTGKKEKSNMENLPPTIDLADSDDNIERTEDRKIRNWKVAEKTCVFEFILGPTEAAERCFEQHKVNPSRVYKHVSYFTGCIASELFNGTHTPQSVKSMYMRLLETFTWIRAFNNFTGNGGGDADCDDPEAILKGRIAAACRSGLPLGFLKPATVTEWEHNGWYELFDGRLGTSAKVAREVVRSSASAISDLDDDSSDSDAAIHPELCKATVRVPKTPAATVSEPKHTPSSAFRKQVTNSFSGLGDFMKMKAVAEEKKASVLDARLVIEREKLEMDKTKGKVEMAEKVLSMAGASDEAKVAANMFLLNLFS